MFNSCRNFHLTTGNNHVAHYYLFNTEKPENHRKAFELVMAKLIWHHDDSESHYLLGHMYHFGLGVPKDYNEAIKYYMYCLLCKPSSK
jgi:TPR repeat protein